MYPLRTASLILFVVSVTFIGGCSDEKYPVTPESPSRNISYFLDSNALFDDPLFNYDEIDLGALGLSYPGGGCPAEIDGLHWCIAITVEHDADEDRILYSWLNEDQNGFAYGGQPAASGVFFGGNDPEEFDFEIRAAKVAAAYLYNEQTPGNSLIEVSVVFMYRDRNPTPTRTWGIGIAQGLWYVNDFPAEPFILPTGFRILASEVPLGNWSPDVAYNYDNGDIHVVWTKWVDDIDPDRARLACRRYIRGDNWLPTYIVTEDNPVQQWIPRIAIGDAGLGDPRQVVAVAYTRKQTNPDSPGDPLPWHVGCAYWDAFAHDPNDLDTTEIFALFYDVNNEAGLPQIAVTLGDCQEKYGSIVFTQYTGDGYQVMEINNIRNGFWVVNSGILPSVTCHYLRGADGLASISYYEPDEPGEWRVTYGRFDPVADPPNPQWQYMTEDGDVQMVNGSFGPIDYGDYVRIHTFQGSEIVATNIGVWDQAYWVAWCDYIDSAATTVYAALGDTQ